MIGLLHAQCSLYEVPLQKRIELATIVAEGKVVSSFSFWNDSHENIYTSHRIEVYKIFKGTLATNEMILVTEGGTVDNDMEVTSSLLTLAEGDIGIFTCRPSSIKLPDGVYKKSTALEVVASKQGFIKYDLHSLSADDVFNRYQNVFNDVYKRVLDITRLGYRSVKSVDLTRRDHHGSYGKNLKAPVIKSFSPLVIPAGTGDRLTITGSGFGNTRGNGKVGFKNTEDGGKTYSYPHASQYRSWTDSQIVVELPDSAGTGIVVVSNNEELKDSSLTMVLTVPYSRSTILSKEEIKRPQLIDKASTGGYVWQMNVDFNSNTVAKTAFLNSLIKWRCATQVNWTIGSTSFVVKNANDNVNVVSLDTYDKLQEGVLGVCFSYYSACSNDGKWHVSGYDIIFRDTSIWHFGDGPITNKQYDFESVALHELGHGQQLKHVIDPADLMHYSIGRGVTKRTLNSNNLKGAGVVLASSTTSGACTYFPMRLLNTVICSDPSIAFFEFKGIEIIPNPFNEVSYMSFILETKAHVKISLYNILGQHLSLLEDGEKAEGAHKFEVEAARYGMRKGVYIVRLTVDGKEYSQKLVKL